MQQKETTTILFKEGLDQKVDGASSQIGKLDKLKNFRFKKDGRADSIKPFVPYSGIVKTSERNVSSATVDGEAAFVNVKGSDSNGRFVRTSRSVISFKGASDDPVEITTSKNLFWTVDEERIDRELAGIYKSHYVENNRFQLITWLSKDVEFSKKNDAYRLNYYIKDKDTKKFTRKTFDKPVFGAIGVVKDDAWCIIVVTSLRNELKPEPPHNEDDSGYISQQFSLERIWGTIVSDKYIDERGRDRLYSLAYPKNYNRKTNKDLTGSDLVIKNKLFDLHYVDDKVIFAFISTAIDNEGVNTNANLNIHTIPDPTNASLAFSDLKENVKPLSSYSEFVSGEAGSRVYKEIHSVNIFSSRKSVSGEIKLKVGIAGSEEQEAVGPDRFSNPDSTSYVLDVELSPKVVETVVTTTGGAGDDDTELPERAPSAVIGNILPYVSITAFPPEIDITRETTETTTARAPSGCGRAFARVPSQDFETLEAANNLEPRGMWSDGTTIWIADTVADKIFAYNLQTKQRDESQDFDTLRASDNNQFPRGIWSDGTTMWVADHGNVRIYAYNLQTKERDPSKYFDTLNAAGNRPSGLWSDGTTMWVADVGNEKIFAYNLQTKQRDASKDFDTLKAAGNTRPTGIWSDGVTMWVADRGDTKIYAYNLQTKQRDESKEYNNLTGVSNGGPHGLWSDGTILWVADNLQDKVVAYNLPNRCNENLYARVPEKDFNTFRADGITHPEGIWSDGTTIWISNEASGGRNFLRAYVLETRERDPSKDITGLTEAGNTNSNDIWSDGTTIWVSDSQDDKLFAYNLATRQRDESQEFNTLSAAGNTDPSGIWSDGTTMWVTDNDHNKIFAYNLMTKQRDAAKDLDTLDAAGNTNPSGLFGDGVTLWVSDREKTQIYAYTIQTKQRDPSRDITLIEPNVDAGSLWGGGDTLYITDDQSVKVFAYRISLSKEVETTSTEEVTTLDFFAVGVGLDFDFNTPDQDPNEFSDPKKFRNFVNDQVLYLHHFDETSSEVTDENTTYHARQTLHVFASSVGEYESTYDSSVFSVNAENELTIPGVLDSNGRPEVIALGRPGEGSQFAIRAIYSDLNEELFNDYPLEFTDRNTIVVFQRITAEGNPKGLYCFTCKVERDDDGIPEFSRQKYLYHNNNVDVEIKDVTYCKRDKSFYICLSDFISEADLVARNDDIGSTVYALRKGERGWELREPFTDIRGSALSIVYAEKSAPDNLILYSVFKNGNNPVSLHIQALNIFNNAVEDLGIVDNGTDELRALTVRKDKTLIGAGKDLIMSSNIVTKTAEFEGGVEARTIHTRDMQNEMYRDATSLLTDIGHISTIEFNNARPEIEITINDISGTQEQVNTINASEVHEGLQFFNVESDYHQKSNLHSMRTFYYKNTPYEDRPWYTFLPKNVQDNGTSETSSRALVNGTVLQLFSHKIIGGGFKTLTAGRRYNRSIDIVQKGRTPHHVYGALAKARIPFNFGKDDPTNGALLWEISFLLGNLSDVSPEARGVQDNLFIDMAINANSFETGADDLRGTEKSRFFFLSPFDLRVYHLVVEPNGESARSQIESMTTSMSYEPSSIDISGEFGNFFAGPRHLPVCMCVDDVNSRLYVYGAEYHSSVRHPVTPDVGRLRIGGVNFGSTVPYIRGLFSRPDGGILTNAVLHFDQSFYNGFRSGNFAAFPKNENSGKMVCYDINPGSSNFGSKIEGIEYNNLRENIVRLQMDARLNRFFTLLAISDENRSYTHYIDESAKNAEIMDLSTGEANSFSIGGRFSSVEHGINATPNPQNGPLGWSLAYKGSNKRGSYTGNEPYSDKICLGYSETSRNEAANTIETETGLVFYQTGIVRAARTETTRTEFDFKKCNFYKFTATNSAYYLDNFKPSFNFFEDDGSSRFNAVSDIVMPPSDFDFKYNAAFQLDFSKSAFRNELGKSFLHEGDARLHRVLFNVIDNTVLYSRGITEGVQSVYELSKTGEDVVNLLYRSLILDILPLGDRQKTYYLSAAGENLFSFYSILTKELDKNFSLESKFNPRYSVIDDNINPETKLEGCRIDRKDYFCVGSPRVAAIGELTDSNTHSSMYVSKLNKNPEEGGTKNLSIFNSDGSYYMNESPIVLFDGKRLSDLGFSLKPLMRVENALDIDRRNLELFTQYPSMDFTSVFEKRDINNYSYAAIEKWVDGNGKEHYSGTELTSVGTEYKLGTKITPLDELGERRGIRGEDFKNFNRITLIGSKLEDKNYFTEIYRTRTNGSLYKLIKVLHGDEARFATTDENTKDELSDEEWDKLDSKLLEPQYVDRESNYQPSNVKGMTAFSNYALIWGVSENPNAVYISRRFDRLSFKPVEFVNSRNHQFPEEIISVSRIDDVAIIVTKNKLFAINVENFINSNPIEIQCRPNQLPRSHRCVVPIESGLIWFSAGSGFFLLDRGRTLRYIGPAVENFNSNLCLKAEYSESKKECYFLMDDAATEEAAFSPVGLEGESDG